MKSPHRRDWPIQQDLVDLALTTRKEWYHGEAIGLIERLEESRTALRKFVQGILARDD